MKVAFVTQPWNPIIPPVEGGSLAIWVYQVSQRCKSICDIVIYSRNAGSQTESERFEGVLYKRLQISGEEKWTKVLKLFERSLGYPRPKMPVYASKFFFSRYIREIAQDINRERCEIVHIFNFSQFVPVVRAQNPDAKIVLHMHCEWLTQLDRAAVENRLRETDLVVGVSDYITNKIRDHFPHFADKCCTIYNAVDYDQYAGSGERSLAPTDDKKRLLFVGRGSPEKGVHVLLDAFRQVASVEPNIYLDIVGHVASAPYEYMVLVSEDQNVSKLASFYDRPFRRSEYFAHLRNRIPDELADRVNFVGQVYHSTTVDYYRKADLLINPSLSEAFGMTLVEAMASGTPVVATRVGGMVEIIEQSRGGKLVEPNNADELAGAILELLSNPVEYQALRARGQKSVRDLFTWERTANDLVTHYRRLCS